MSQHRISLLLLSCFSKTLLSRQKEKSIPTRWSHVNILSWAYFLKMLHPKWTKYFTMKKILADGYNFEFSHIFGKSQKMQLLRSTKVDSVRLIFTKSQKLINYSTNKLQLITIFHVMLFTSSVCCSTLKPWRNPMSAYWL